MEKAPHTDILFLKVILYEGGWFLCVCYKAFIKGMKCGGILSATSSFPRHVDLTSLKQPLQGLGLEEQGFLWLGAGSPCLPRKEARGRASRFGGALS